MLQVCKSSNIQEGEVKRAVREEKGISGTSGPAIKRGGWCRPQGIGFRQPYPKSIFDGLVKSPGPSLRGAGGSCTMPLQHCGVLHNAFKFLLGDNIVFVEISPEGLVLLPPISAKVLVEKGFEAGEPIAVLCNPFFTRF